MIGAKLATPTPSVLLPPSPRLRGRRLSPTAASCLPDTGTGPPVTAGSDLDRPVPAGQEAAAVAGAVSSPPRSRASSQLSRWSRARAVRSGRRLEWPATRGSATVSVPTSSPPAFDQETAAAEEEDDDVCDVSEVDGEAAANSIYMVSDGTGSTLEQSVNAVLGQFEHCLVDRRCATSTHLFSGVDDMDNLIKIVKQAAKEGALLLYTLADPSMAEATKKACDLWGVPSTDVLRPTIEAIASHIGVAPSGIPRSSASRKGQLSEDYFRRIEAIDFTIKQDDGAQPQNLARAHIVLVGVSRTGKTPLSIYLAQKGYKVANVPIVMGIDLPKALFEIDQDKIFGLTINPVVLQAIRKARANTLGFNGQKSNYAEMEHVRQELDHANQIFVQHPTWPVIQVTGKAIEETAAVIVRIYHDRKQKCSMPRISKRVAPIRVYDYRLEMVNTPVEAQKVLVREF
ncbi:probable pyruvate, phosphate dikinase regulatory protein, chloroplastic isoform X2 [Lolium rigidum]|uniref:probable pyruvate, phosphate dikinase regulatory protein, chloroplastic isoform X2 n=1 Tax=Lolium rigidum TaxID=89674 RepID=UPI001F5DE94F|nr:probable pyruvate, phosphate dikinase regulatory protein, chloroplastic isoform X2 [Lolium rigidum]